MACFNGPDLNDLGRMETDNGLVPGDMVFAAPLLHGGVANRGARGPTRVWWRGQPRLHALNHDKFLQAFLRNYGYTNDMCTYSCMYINTYIYMFIHIHNSLHLSYLRGTWRQDIEDITPCFLKNSHLIFDKVIISTRPTNFKIIKSN